jgi:hypothetical protein
MSEQVKACADCKWCASREELREWRAASIWVKCQHPKSRYDVTPDRYSGRGFSYYETVEKQRDGGLACGLEGRLWEPATPSLIKRLIDLFRALVTKPRPHSPTTAERSR